MNSESIDLFPNSPKNRNAFTLVELLVVMAALTILAAVTLPSLRTLLSDQKTSSASRIVQAHLDAARTRAIATGRPVAAILERNGVQTNAVTQLSIGQVFPPYEGDSTFVTGTLSDNWGKNGSGVYEAGFSDGFYDTITIPVAFAALLGVTSPSPVFTEGDFIQIGDREHTFSIRQAPTIASGNVSIAFVNPPFARDSGSGIDYPIVPPALPVRGSATPAYNTSASSPAATNLGANQAKFRVFRKPSKSFGQRSILPRGTCIDMTVSGQGTGGNDFYDTSGSATLVMIVFGANGTVSYMMDGTGTEFIPSGIIHLLIGTTDQISTVDLSTTAPEVADEADDATFNSNINDADSVWVSINPYSGAIYSSSVQTGSEGSLLSVRLPVARQLANNAINVTKN